MAPTPAPRDAYEADRRAGVLLHPTSLPGPYGIGDIGPAARHFVTWLASARQRIWQMLPTNPVDGFGSPYAAPSAFARNPLLLSIDDLVTDGLLLAAEKPETTSPWGRIDYATARARKGPALALAASRLAEQVDLMQWASARPWLTSWSRYATLADVYGERWTDWPLAVRDHVDSAVDEAVAPHQAAQQRHLALQWLFEHQWKKLRATAREHGVSLWGDIPFFVGGQSCDVWSHRELFRLDARGLPTVLSGVPPDAFSQDGQTWGTPLYNNAAHQATGFQWWCDRLATTLELFDEIRLDHFRGIAGVWEVPRHGRAREGQWIPSLGAPMLAALQGRFDPLPLIAEDLGVITPDVIALREQFGLRGMVILQFAFSSAWGTGHQTHLPHNHCKRQVVYPATHDNDTCVGWYQSADEGTRDHLRRYLSSDGRDPAGDLLRTAFRSVASDAVVAMQDVLRLDGSARMNIPGQAHGNWGWRMPPDALTPQTARWLAFETQMCGRAGTSMRTRDHLG